MSTPSPCSIYYRACVGRWRGVMNATVTDPRALFRAMGVFNGFSVLMMAWWPRWLGRFELETTVEYDPTNPVRHTTTLYWLRLPLMESVEYVTPHDDGVHFKLEGETRIHTMPWRRLTVTGSGQVDPTATRATYCVTWLGTELEQTTIRKEGTVTLSQKSPGFAATQNLRAIQG